MGVRIYERSGAAAGEPLAWFEKREGFLSAILDTIGVSIIVVKDDCSIVYANRAYCEKFDKAADEVIGTRCYEIHHNPEKPCYIKYDQYRCAAGACFDTGRRQKDLHVVYPTGDLPHYLGTSAYPLTDADGSVRLVVMTMLDVTDRVNLEQKLVEAVDKYRTLYDSAPDMMYSLDGDAVIILCNRTMAATLGYEPDEMIGRSLAGFLTPESRRWSFDRFLQLKKKGYFEGEMDFLTRDGRQVPVFVKSKVICDEHQRFLMCDSIARDIREKKEMEEQLLHSEKMRALGRMAGGVAHDFNNVLTAITGYAELIVDDPETGAKARHYAEQILASVGHAAGINRGLLTFSRKHAADFRPVSLNDVIEERLDFLERLLGTGIRITAALSAEDPVIVADAVQIGQILMNFASNARDAMPEGGEFTIRTDVVESSNLAPELADHQEAERYAVMTVSDTGKGMDDATSRRIFEPFFTTKEPGRGTGLGLSIVFGLVRQHNGVITVESEPGKGTVFRVLFPLHRVA
ncbi:PAS domain S-box protein [Geobacter sp.]|uniref:PAS domain-containing sensor histidine kinase n=1 Tax=Geobacter sp. TaxID=46610 RepID=UPI0027B8D977|nr:PAS domain S-box protein [Geobacter sp.]